MNDKACDLCGENKGHRGPGLCHCCNLQARNRTLEVELEKCREALNWYADPDNYETYKEQLTSEDRNGIKLYLEYETSAVREDYGKRARQALERMGEK